MLSNFEYCSVMQNLAVKTENMRENLCSPWRSHSLLGLSTLNYNFHQETAVLKNFCVFIYAAFLHVVSPKSKLDSTTKLFNVVLWSYVKKFNFFFANRKFIICTLRMFDKISLSAQSKISSIVFVKDCGCIWEGSNWKNMLSKSKQH